MFVDKVDVTVKAGDGGNGIVSFRHEKFVDKGGPDGGDGGKGGDVIFESSRNQNTLVSFRYQKHLEAKAGQAGSKRKMHGKNGNDLIVKVPLGTVVNTADGTVIADLSQDGQSAVIAVGGRGGFGNAHFTSSTRQAPRVAEKGEKGEALQLTLELKMIADVGLIGLPNAGKSTLLASASNARPEIANYPFTTLQPNLGVVDIDKKTALLFADIPGLIEGASQGKGLGDEFLRHVERTHVLVHLIDIYNDDIATAYHTIQKELKAYKADLTSKPQLVVLNKIDGLDDEIVADKTAELKKAIPKKAKILAMSAKSKHGLKDVLYAINSMVDKHRTQTAEVLKEVVDPDIPVIRLKTDNSWSVEKSESGYRITGNKIERFADMTDFSNEAALVRLRDIMQKMGILHELVRQGIEPGDSLIIGEHSLIY